MSGISVVPILADNNGNGFLTPADMNIFIDDRISIAEQLHKCAKKYFDGVSSYLAGHNPAQSQKISTAIQDITHLIGRIKKAMVGPVNTESTDEPISLAKSLELINCVYADITALADNVFTMTRFVRDQHLKYIVLKQMSSSFAAIINDQINHVLRRGHEFNVESVESDNKFFNHFIRKVPITESHLDVVFEFAMSAPAKTTFSEFIIGFAIRNSTGIRLIKLQRIVDEYIDESLGIKSRPQDTTRIMAHQGLQPVSPTGPIKDVALLVGLADSTDDAEIDFMNFVHLAQKQHVGVIHLINICQTPIEYSIGQLIDAEYVQQMGLMTPPMHGLNKTFAKRFATITLLDPTDNRASPASIETVRYPNDRLMSSYYVVESIVRNKYRLLSNKMKQYQPIPAELLRGLIYGISIRPHQYATLAEEAIIENCQEPNAIRYIGRFVDSSKFIESSDTTKRKVLIGILTWYDADRPRNMKHYQAFKKFILDKRKIMDIVLEIISQRNYNGGDATLTQISKIMSIANTFYQEFDRKINDITVPSQLFIERTDPDAAEYLRQILSDSVKFAADFLDQSNLWAENQPVLKEIFMK